MLPLIKLAGLLIKLLLRPFVVYTQNLAIRMSNKNSLYIFQQLGQFEHRFTTKLERKMLNFSAEMQEREIKPLTEEAALNRGTETFSEILIYGVFIVYGVYELNRASQERSIRNIGKEMRRDELNIQDSALGLY